MSTVKIAQKAAFHLEAGQAGAGISPGWGTSGSEEALGANDAYPWLTWPSGKEVGNVRDNAMSGTAYQDVPRKVLEHVESAWGMPLRFNGLNSILYWCFGLQTYLKLVVCFVGTPASAEPVAGDTYRDQDNNDFTFYRKEVWADTSFYVFRAVDSVAPLGATGNLLKQTGTGSTLSFTAHSPVMAEHLFELDINRHFTDYEAAVRPSGWATGDKKNRMATVGLQTSVSDYRYKNAMCKSFNFSSSAGQLAELSGDLVAYDEERGSFNSAAWTHPSTRAVSDNIVAHHQLRVQLGASESTLVNVGVTEASVGVGIPLQVLQDTESGLHIAEPLMEGQYDVTANVTLSRYSAATYQAYRDAWTSVVARIAAKNGYDMLELLVNEAKLPNAGPDGDSVSKEPLTLAVGSGGVNNWADWLYDNTLAYGGPLVLRVRNLTSTNSMFEV